MSMRIEDLDEVITVEELARVMKVGRNSAYAMVRENRIKSIKNGTRYLIPKQSVIDFLNQSTDTKK